MSDIQAEQSVPVIPTEPKRFGRRDFLQALGITTVGGALAGTGVAAAIKHHEPAPEQNVAIPESSQELNNITPENKLEKAGLGEFIPIYLQSQLFFEKWGVYPPVFSKIQNQLVKVIEDDPDSQDSELYKNLISQWGDKIQDEEEEDSDRNIEFSSDVNAESQKHIQNVYKKTLRAFRPLAKVTTPHMKYGGDVALICKYDAEGNPALGCTDRESFTHLGNQTDVNFVSTLLHESNHNFLDNFGENLEVLKYITKRHLIDYFSGTISLIDQFMTDVAEDTSTNPAEYTYGFANWKDRSKTRNKLAEYQSILGLEEKQATQPTTITYTNLPEDPQYNRVLRTALKKRLNNPSERNTDTLDEMIESEMKFLYHILHNIELDKPIQVGKNSNAIIQRFLDMKITHQRLWLPLASGGTIASTTALDSLRSKCGLPDLQSADELQDEQKPWDFDYKAFGGTTLSETRSEFIKVNVVSMPECPTDQSNYYLAVDISSVMNKKSMPNTLLVSIPRLVQITECKIDNNERILLLLSDNTQLAISTGVNSDPTSPHYGSIAFQEGNISSNNDLISFMAVQKSKLTKPTFSNLYSQIGLAGSLNHNQRTKSNNIPSIGITDIDNKSAAYAISTDIQIADGDAILFKGKNADGAAIINTKDGPKLFINTLPPTSDYNNVPDLISDMELYGATIIGEKQLLDFAKDPDSLRIDYQIHSSHKEKSGIVSATIIAEKDGVIRIFPIFVR